MSKQLLDETEINAIREMVPRLGVMATAAKLHRHDTTVRKYAHTFGFIKPWGRPWTAAEDQHLIANYTDASAPLIGTQLNRSKGSVIGRANRLGLSSPQQKTIRRAYRRNNGPRPEVVRRYLPSRAAIKKLAAHFLAWRREQMQWGA